MGNKSSNYFCCKTSSQKLCRRNLHKYGVRWAKRPQSSITLCQGNIAYTVSTLYFLQTLVQLYSTQEESTYIQKSFKFTLFHCLWNILLWEIQQLCQIILSLPQLQNTTSVSNNSIIATTSNYKKPSLLVTIAITAITLYIEFTTKQIPISL